MSKSERRKGHDFERWIARWFREKTGLGAEREWQFRGGADRPDVLAPPFAVECKNSKAPNVRRALMQAEASAPRGTWPIAVCHYHGEKKGASIVAMRLDDFGDFVREWKERGE